MTRKEKKDNLKEVMARLERLYPNAECALEYESDSWKLLVMARLSAQCTDKRVNIVSKELFKRFPTAEKMAQADITKIEEIVKPCGLYKSKAQNIKDSSLMLVEQYGSKLPDEMDELLKFPGVGRKIANLLLGDVFGKPAIVCDTHCIRICGRLGMYPEKEKNAEKVEKVLRSLMDVERGSDFCHRIVIFGREVCTARNPNCEKCPLSDLCQSKSKVGKTE